MEIFYGLYVLCFLATSVLSQLIPVTPSLDIWPPGPGKLLEPQVPNAELVGILNQIDTTRIQATIQKLTTFGTRHTLSSQTDPVRGIGAARDWIASEMRSIAATSNGRMTVTVQEFLQQPSGTEIPNPTNITNVFITLTGSKEPNRAYVVSGHYDSRVTDLNDFTDDAPGADDDASGVAVSMELARVMATHKSAATLIFAAVAGEEQGLFGSAFMAAQLKKDGVDVQGMLDNDIVGSSTADDGTIDKFDLRMFVQGIPTIDNASEISELTSIGAENDSPAHQLGRFVSEVSQNTLTQMNVRTIYRPDRFLRGGDHLSFLDQGFPAVRFTEPHENFAHQHQNTRVINGVQFGDLIEFVDMDFVNRVAKVNGAALWSLGQAPGTPKNAFMDTSILTNNSTLTWTQDPNADGGYEIVWRQSDEPLWSRAIPVGKTNTATVLLSKDNVQMGIRSVGSNGFKSPAAFPLP